MGRKAKNAIAIEATEAKIPKRCKSSFFFFSDVFRQKLKSTTPPLTTSELSKRLSAAWASLTEEDKAPYKELAAQDKARIEALQVKAGICKTTKRAGMLGGVSKPPPGWRRMHDHTLSHDFFLHVSTRTIVLEMPNDQNVPAALMAPPAKKILTPFQLFCRKNTHVMKGAPRKARSEHLRKLFEGGGEEEESAIFDF